MSDDPPGGPAALTTRSWSIGALHAAISGVLDECFGSEVWIEGEITKVFTSKAGHTYLTLSDPDADSGRSQQPVLEVTLWKYQAAGIRKRLREAGGAVELADGVRVRVCGSLGTYAPRSQLQLKMTDLDPAFTLGVLGQERARVLEALTREGLLDRNSSVPLGVLPLRVALVTSVGSAAHADTLHELERWGVPFTVLQLHSSTQGQAAPGELVAALRTAERLEADVVLLVRGGGAATDLAAFDDEQLARTIADLRVPVVTGIGHEVDHSIADDVAHTSRKTPTAAAAFVAEHATGTLDRFGELAEAVVVSALGRLDATDLRLQQAAQRLAVRSDRLLTRAAARTDEAWRRVDLGARRRLERVDERLRTLESQRQAVDPAVAMARGWSITRGPGGALVRDPADVEVGAELTTTVAAGVVRSTVTVTSPTTGPGST